MILNSSLEELKERAQEYADIKIKHIQRLYPDVPEYKEDWYYNIIVEEVLKQMLFSKMCLEKSRELYQQAIV